MGSHRRPGACPAQWYKGTDTQHIEEQHISPYICAGLETCHSLITSKQNEDLNRMNFLMLYLPLFTADNRLKPMSYNVYRVSYAGMPRDHHAIFVEKNSDESGWLFQVTGDVQRGMVHDDKAVRRPEDSATYQGKELIGQVTAANFNQIKGICCTIPPPKKQFEGPRRLYPREPIRRCQEWTAEAIQALRDGNVLTD